MLGMSLTKFMSLDFYSKGPQTIFTESLGLLLDQNFGFDLKKHDIVITSVAELNTRRLSSSVDLDDLSESVHDHRLDVDAAPAQVTKGKLHRCRQ
jgi:hypothetical protein